MKHIFTVLALFVAFSINAQFDSKKIKQNNSSEISEGLNIKWDKLPQPKATTKSNQQAVNFNTLQFEVDKQSAFNVTRQNDNGSVQWMIGYAPSEKSQSIESRAQSLLTYASKTMGLDLGKNTFEPLNKWTDKLGNQHIKLAQFHQGVKVYGSEIILHEKNDRIYLQNGAYVLDKELPKEKSEVIGLEAAQKNVKDVLTNLMIIGKSKMVLIYPLQKHSGKGIGLL